MPIDAAEARKVLADEGDYLLTQVDRLDFSETVWALAKIIRFLRRAELAAVVSPETATDDIGFATLVGPIVGSRGVAGDVAALYQLALAGALTMDLDAEDFHRVNRWPDVPTRVQSTLTACAWPTRSVTQDQTVRATGAMHDLRPTYGLLLELVRVYYQRHDMAGVLSLLHLASDHLGLLAWRDSLGDLHPATLAGVVASHEAIWGTAVGKVKCPQLNRVRQVVKGVNPRSPKPLIAVLQVLNSRAAAMIIECSPTGGFSPGGLQRCTRPCGVPATTLAAGDRAATNTLAERTALAQFFSRSDIVLARHGSPVGHFFSVPTRHEVDAMWAKTCSTLAAECHDAATKTGRPAWTFPEVAGEPLPGLGALFAHVAGDPQPMAEATVTEALTDEFRRRLSDAVAGGR